MNNSKGFKQAQKESYRSDYDGNKISRHLGCAIYYKGELLALGHNTEKTHPIQYKYNCERFICDSSPAKTHAETMALNKIRFLDIDFKKIDVYTWREYEDGKRAMAKPCPSCERYMKELGIRKIHYTIEDDFKDEIYA